jgi:pyruvate carboxylase
MTDAPIKSLLIANRSEIAIRVMRAAAEMDIRAVAIYSKEDRLALHRVKSDESYLVGEGKKPLAAYLDIDDILRIARQANVDTIPPGYGFLPENPLHVVAPMPGSVVAVAVQLGQRVAAGSTLIALEAMKMETHIVADRDCLIAAVHVQAGDRVAAKDLLIELREASG